MNQKNEPEITNTDEKTVKKLTPDKKKIIILVSALAAITLVLIIVFTVLSKEEKPQTEPVATEEPTPTPVPTPVPTPTPEAVVLPENFQIALMQNPHVYAWIEIPDTNVNYPILQHPEDNQYYLTHTILGEEKTEGSIYTENYNTKDFTDGNTIIYGHNMRNGSMFKHLHKFEDLDFFNSHRTMYIYTQTQKLEYRIYAAYVTDSRHLLATYNFNDAGVFTTYINEVFNGRSSIMQGGNLDTSINLNSANKIITLQTCTGNDNTRYLVQAVLTKVTGTPDIVVPNTLCVTGSAVSK